MRKGDGEGEGGSGKRKLEGEMGGSKGDDGHGERVKGEGGGEDG